jgi:Ser/Thr protein kinase RdoA (MazF antagonist)
MASANDTFSAPSAEQQRVLTLAEAALQHYALGLTIPTFLQHNAGVVFRVEAPERGRAYLLKLHERIGSGSNPSAAQLEAGLRWLAEIARETDLVVQAPIPTTAGPFVSQVFSTDGMPISCTLQAWVEGEPPHGDLSEQQVRQIGAVMAKLHHYSRQHPVSRDLAAMQHDAVALQRNVALLGTALDTTLLPGHAWDVLVAAQDRIVALMSRLGTAPEVWGPVHGDLHYDNVLFSGDEVRLIDMTGLRLAHYAYDIGVTLYHIFYQGPQIRRAFFEGYQQRAPLPEGYQRLVEAFVTYAAIDNLAWNSTIPEQRVSALFRGNVQQLIDTFCRSVAEGRPFLFS